MRIKVSVKNISLKKCKWLVIYGEPVTIQYISEHIENKFCITDASERLLVVFIFSIFLQKFLTESKIANQYLHCYLKIYKHKLKSSKLGWKFLSPKHIKDPFNYPI